MKAFRKLLLAGATTVAIIVFMVTKYELHHGFLESRHTDPEYQFVTVSTVFAADDSTNSTTASSFKTETESQSFVNYSSVMPWLNISDQIQEMYLLSGYWDDRSPETSPVLISTLVFMKQSENYQIYCHILCDDDNNIRVAPVPVDDFHRELGHGRKEFDDNFYWRVVIPCPTAGCERPRRVTVSHNKLGMDELDDSNSVPIQYPVKDMKHEFGICVPPIFGCLDPNHVVEWMEIQKLLGVSKIVIHNNSQCEETSRVFRHYAREGLVELRQDHTVLDCDDNKTFGGWNMPMSRLELFVRDPLMLTDCMYRHMHDIKHFLFLDMDEIVVPAKVASLRELLDQIERDLGVVENEFYQITFRSFFFLIDEVVTPHPADKSFPDYMFFLRHRKRLGPSPDNLRPKSLVSGERCAYVHNHECPAQIQYHKLEAKHPQEKMLVPPTIGKVHHYRVEACKRKASGKISCQDGVSDKPVYDDNDMVKYSEQLMSNVRKQHNKLALNVE